MRIIFLLVILFLTACQSGAGLQPIIDVHRHGSWPTSLAPGAERNAMFAELNAHKVVLSVVAITSPTQIEVWTDEAQNRFIAGAMMPCPQNLAEPWFLCFPETEGMPDLFWLRENIQSGHIGALHEMMFNYDGSLPSSEKMDPYWGLAAEFEIPVGVHTWSGPPPGRSIRNDPNCCPNYDGDMGNPRNLRPVLEKYPGLRVWIQHVGSDGDMNPELWDETLTLLSDYPNVYLDLSITNSVLPIEEYEAALMRLIEAGYGDRVMFGSDGLPIELIVSRLDGIKGISDEQRSAILYDNAAEFLKLSPEIRRHHHRQ